MTNETPLELSEEERIAADKHRLEVELHAYLHHYFTQVRELDPEAKMYDPEGKTAFVVIGFNNPVSDEVLLDGFPDTTELTNEDRAVAIASSSIAVMPYVIPDPETKQIGPPETIRHGVQAIACAMLLSSLQQGAVHETMAMAQQTILRTRKMT